MRKPRGRAGGAVERRAVRGAEQEPLPIARAFALPSRPICWCDTWETAARSGIGERVLRHATPRGKAMRTRARWTAGAVTLLLAGVLSGNAQPRSLRLGNVARRVHVAQSAPSAWSAPELIPAHELGTPAPAHPPVFDAKGDAVVVWTEARLSIKEAITLEYLVRTSVRPVDGHWQPAETLSRLGLDPDVAVDAHGDTIAVWQSPPGVQAAIRPAGGSWLAPQTVATPGGEEPQIASDASGDVIVVSTRQAPGHSSGIQAVLRPAGGTFSPAQVISAPGNDFYPRLAMNARGDALVAWERDTARGCLVEAAFGPANGRWSRPRVLSDTHVGCPANQQVAIDARGDGVVAWVTLRGRTQFVESAGRSASGRWTTRVLAKAPHIDETVGVRMDARGDVMVVWHEEALNGGRSAIWARIRPAGRGWGTARTISRTHGGPPSLAIDARGDALITWQDKRGIEAAARPAGGSWQKPDTVSAHERSGPGVGDDGLAALDARGDALATWQNREGIKTAWHSSLFP